VTESATGTQRVQLTVQADLAEIRLTWPERFNAIDPAWVAALAEAIEGCAVRDDIRAVLICADGRRFSVGGDLEHFAARAADLDVALAEMVPPYHVALERLASLPYPVVCAVQGSAAGGGLGLLYSADVVISADDAVFACGFSELGVSGDGGGTWYLPRLVGLRRAQELMYLGRRLTAQEALEWGLITTVVPADELEQRARAVASTLAAGPTIAFAHMRRMLRESWGASLREQLTSESEAILACGETQDAREGMRSFYERRRPSFNND